MKKKKEQTYLVTGGEPEYDDCPICQAMKKAEEEGRNLSEKELAEVFAMANATQKSKELSKKN